ncbi:MAG: hypothetical protein QM765_38775 [Myxococcales bacterium]
MAADDLKRGVTETNGPYFPEFDLTPEQRLEAAAKILLDAMREMYAKRNREKTRRCRARKRAAKAATIEPGAPAGESADESKSSRSKPLAQQRRRTRPQHLENEGLR